jgi:hypothetical protein
LDVNYLLKQYSNVTVTISDNEGKVLLRDENTGVLTLHKRFDLSKLPEGAYIVEVTNGQDHFTEVITR